MALFGADVNHTLVTQVSADASYGEVIEAVDPDFAAACTLFENSLARHSSAAMATYIALMHDAMAGTMPVKVAADRILDLAY